MSGHVRVVLSLLQGHYKVVPLLYQSFPLFEVVGPVPLVAGRPDVGSDVVSGV